MATTVPPPGMRSGYATVGPGARCFLDKCAVRLQLGPMQRQAIGLGGRPHRTVIPAMPRAMPIQMACLILGARLRFGQQAGSTSAANAAQIAQKLIRVAAVSTAAM